MWGLGEGRDPFPPLEDYLKEHRPEDMDGDECETLASMLHSMLRYDPDERAKPAALLKHPWFACATRAVNERADGS